MNDPLILEIYDYINSEPQFRNERTGRQELYRQHFFRRVDYDRYSEAYNMAYNMPPERKERRLE